MSSSVRTEATKGEQLWFDVFGNKPAMQQNGCIVTTGHPILETEPEYEEPKVTASTMEQDVWSLVFSTNNQKQ